MSTQHPSYTMLSPKPLPEGLHSKIQSFTNVKETSHKNVWVKLTSGGGLTIVSNPDIPTFGMKSIHGSLETDAPVGLRGFDYLSTTDNIGYKPRPIIESVEIKNGKMGVTRKATINMKVFTISQLEEILPYFLEPGMSIVIEWGWNTQESVGQIFRDRTVVGEIVDYEKTKKRKSDGMYEYENYLGNVTGGNVTYDTSGFWSITVETVGIGDLVKSLENDSAGKSGEETNDKSATVGGLFKSVLDKIKSITHSIMTSASAIFKQRVSGTDWDVIPFIDMYSQLPSIFQTTDVKDLETDAVHKRHYNYIGFGDVVNERLNGGAFDSMFREMTGYTLDASSPYGVELDGEHIVDSERFIRFGTLMEIVKRCSSKIYDLQKGITVGGEYYSLLINTNNVPISAFKHIFSKDKSKLLIMNRDLPNFGFLEAFTDANKKSLFELAVLDIDKNIDGTFPHFDVDEFGMKWGVFPGVKDLGSSSGGKIASFDAPRGTWGYLHNLYVNFDFAMDILTKTGVSYNDKLLEILNGMSSAVNNLWDFQIVEDTVDGKTRQSVVDINFLGFNKIENAPGFTHTGVDSPFIDASYTIDLPAAMTSQVVMKRATASGDNGYGLTAQPSLPPPDPVLWQGSKSVVDIIMKTIPKNPKAEDSGAGGDPPSEDETKSANAIQFLRNAGIFTKIYNAEELSRFGADLQKLMTETKIFAATYSDSQIFDNLRSIDNDNNKPNYRFLLPISFNFTTLGVSGIEFGHCFKVTDLVSKFRDSGVFQIKDVSHNINGNTWTTSVETMFRPINE